MTADELQVSPAHFSDAALLAGLHAHCFKRPWGAEAMAIFLAAPEVLCLIGLAGDESPAGLLIARRAADEAELLTLGVTPDHRRHGLGRALLRRALADLSHRGVKDLFLEVGHHNAAALALYRSLGAVPVGQRPGYYEDGADAGIFRLALSDSHSDDGRRAMSHPKTSDR